MHLVESMLDGGACVAALDNADLCAKSLSTVVSSIMSTLASQPAKMADSFLKKGEWKCLTEQE